MKKNAILVVFLSILMGVLVFLSTDCSPAPSGGTNGGGTNGGDTSGGDTSGGGTGSGGTGSGGTGSGGTGSGGTDGGGTGSGGTDGGGTGSGGTGSGGTGSGGTDGGSQPLAPAVVLYTGEAMGGGIGPAIRDAIIADDSAVATVSSLVASQSYSYALGDQSGTLTADAEGKLVITKKLLAKTNAVNGANLTLNKEGGDASAAVVLAVYRPEQIFTWQDLQAIRLDMRGSYRIMKDIQFPAPGTENFPTTGFEAIGTDTTKFTGILDGNRKTITGFFQEHHALNPTGLFGAIDGGNIEVVKNLTMHNASVSGNLYVGVIVGRLYSGTVQAVAVTIDASEQQNKRVTGAGAGGLIGRVESGGIVRGRSYIHVDGQGNSVGGLVGQNHGTVMGFTTAAVSASGHQNIGGLVGNNSGTVIGYATGNVTGYNNIGGLVGYNTGGKVIGYATGVVSGNQYVGGSVGNLSKGTVSGYAIGAVSGSNLMGGFVGYNNEGVVIGYSRNFVTRSSGMQTYIGAFLGVNQLNAGAGYYSALRGVYSLVNADGSPFTATKAGDAITMDASTGSTAFSNFTFSLAVGEWTWVQNGNWPAINLGADVINLGVGVDGTAAGAAEQPTARYTAATAVSAPAAFSAGITPTTTEIALTWPALSVGEAKTAVGTAVDLTRDVAIDLYYLPSDKENEDASAIMAGSRKFGTFMNGSATSATLTGLAAATKYHILLRVVNKTDVSKTSDLIATFTTATAP